MSTDLLTLVGQTQDSALQTTSDKEVSEITKTGDWLPRLQVMGSSSNLVIEQKIPVGVFALIHSKGNFIDLGKKVDFMGLAFRAKAMRFNSKPISVFDRNDAEYKSIQVDSDKPNAGCGWGPEFLIWLPSQSVFATLFCSSKTLRNASSDILTIMKKGENVYGPGVITSETYLIKTDSNIWWGARFFPCTNTLPPTDDPDAWMAKYQEELTKFRNPPKMVVETEEATAPGRAR